MKVVCINSGSTKNLTEGNSYDVVRSTEDHYYIVNDRGITARYSSKLFKQEEVAVAPPPPPPAPVVMDVVLNVRDVKIEWDLNLDEDFNIDQANRYATTINITNPHNQNGEAKVWINSLLAMETPLSCGIMDMQGFNDLLIAFKSKLLDFKEELMLKHINLIITPDVCRTILGNNLRVLVNDIFESDIAKGIINFSSNITSNNTLSDFFGVDSENISDLFDHCFTTHNPNSGNMIFFGSFTN
jgi:hypothetical protein